MIQVYLVTSTSILLKNGILHAPLLGPSTPLATVHVHHIVVLEVIAAWHVHLYLYKRRRVVVERCHGHVVGLIACVCRRCVS